MSAPETLEPSTSSLHLRVKMAVGTVYTVPLPSLSITGAELKKLVGAAEFANVEPHRLRIVFSGKEIHDDTSLNSLDIEHNSLVYAILRVPQPQSAPDASSVSPPPAHEGHTSADLNNPVAALFQAIGASAMEGAPPEISAFFEESLTAGLHFSQMMQERMRARLAGEEVPPLAPPQGNSPMAWFGTLFNGSTQPAPAPTVAQHAPPASTPSVPSSTHASASSHPTPAAPSAAGVAKSVSSAPVSDDDVLASALEALEIENGTTRTDEIPTPAKQQNHPHEQTRATVHASSSTSRPNIQLNIQAMTSRLHDATGQSMAFERLLSTNDPEAQAAARRMMATYAAIAAAASECATLCQQFANERASSS